jgi:hypothetical protein
MGKEKRENLCWLFSMLGTPLRWGFWAGLFPGIRRKIDPGPHPSPGSDRRPQIEYHS